MKSIITSKFRTTIPKAVRENLGLSVKDTLEWKVKKGKVVVYPVKPHFLKYRNTIKTGRGDIDADIELAGYICLEKYR